MELGSSLKEFLIFPAPAKLSIPESVIPIVNTEQSTSYLEILQPRLQEKTEHEFNANWTSDQTKVMLDLYEKYRPKVGSFQIKNLKKLWEVISAEINNILKTNYSSSHVENRWRVVERSYKKFVDNQNKTGRGRKYFEYKEEMENIFRGKKNVKPDVLLSTNTIEHVEEVDVEPANEEHIQSTSNSGTATPQTLGKGLSLKRRNPTSTKNLTLEQLRRDRKEYYKEKIEIEKQKLEVQKQKVILMKERNDLLRERNELLKRDLTL